MYPEIRNCRRCGAAIAPGRLKVIPDTQVCVRCSEKIGGEFELEITTSSSGKAGSLKKTGQEVRIERRRKPLK